MAITHWKLGSGNKQTYQEGLPVDHITETLISHEGRQSVLHTRLLQLQQQTSSQ